MKGEELIDFTKSLDNIKDVKIFFGDYDGIQRYDRCKYPITEKLTKVQQGSMWFPREINYAKDMVAIKQIKPTHEEIYRSNLLFQTLADSYANRFLDNIFSDRITSPEWERVIKWQGLFEMIHSEAYSENIRKVYSDAEQFFNEGFKNKDIQNRLEAELESVIKCINILDRSNNSEAKKWAILELCLRQYALESIRFFISFLYTFQINEINEQSLQGSVNNITLILNDEIIHTTIFRHLLNILRTEKSEGFSELDKDKFSNLAISIFEEVVESEVVWFKYLSSIEEFDGFGEQQIREFLGFYCSNSLSLIKVNNHPFKSTRNNLVEFFESKKDINGTKALAQETEQLSYNIGVLEDKGYYTNDLSEFIQKIGVK